MNSIDKGFTHQTQTQKKKNNLAFSSWPHLATARALAVGAARLPGPAGCAWLRQGRATRVEQDCI